MHYGEEPEMRVNENEEEGGEGREGGIERRNVLHRLNQNDRCTKKKIEMERKNEKEEMESVPSHIIVILSYYYYSIHPHSLICS